MDPRRDPLRDRSPRDPGSAGPRKSPGPRGGASALTSPIASAPTGGRRIAARGMTAGAGPMSSEHPTIKDPPDPGPAILLVDDDDELCELMQAFFARSGLRLEAAHDGRRG